MAAPARPEIFLLSLNYQSFLDETYSSLIDDLHKLGQLKRAKSANGALNYLASSNPQAVIVTDEGLAKAKNKPVLNKLNEYIRNGGRAIYGLHMPNFTGMDVFDDFFTNAYGLPWKSAPYSMKVLHAKNARAHEKIFIPVDDTQTQSHVFPPAFVDQTQAAVVGAKVGEGFVFYMGDVNGEKGSDKVILCLCGLT